MDVYLTGAEEYAGQDGSDHKAEGVEVGNVPTGLPTVYGRLKMPRDTKGCGSSS